jgi:hypothetical protein
MMQLDSTNRRSAADPGLQSQTRRSPRGCAHALPGPPRGRTRARQMIENPWSVEVEFYGIPRGSYGYVNAGRGRGSSSLTNTFKALERRGPVERMTNPVRGWRKVESC